MSNKIIFAGFIAVVVAGCVWWYVSSMNIAPYVSESNSNKAPVTTSTTNTNSIVSNDSSDAALTKDLSNIDNQTNEFTSDNSNINASLNDQPVTQGQ